MLNFDSLQNILIAALALALILSIIIGLLQKRSHPLSGVLNMIRVFILPAGMLLLYLINIEHIPYSAVSIRVVFTIFWIAAVWILASLLKLLLFSPNSEGWRARVPGLLVDLLRFSVVLVGIFLVIALVWEGNLSGALATLGVGSLVIGLALQDTLGNLFSGIALLLERPFQVGDWVKIGDTIGQVTEMNWRAVRIQPRSLDSVVVPNSVLSKERIHNFSRPTTVHGVEVSVGFSYSDPPNKVKRILMQCARATRDILAMGLVVRTTSFADSAVQYRIRFFTERYDRLPDIEEELMTLIWYAAKRNELTIPFPIRTIYKTEMPAPQVEDSQQNIRAALRKTHLFAALDHKELTQLSSDTALENYGDGEEIVREGDEGDTLHVVLEGAVNVAIADGDEIKVIGSLGVGEYFGEMSVLTGEVRSASVIAKGDVVLLSISKAAIQSLFSARPALLQSVATTVTERKLGLQSGRDGAAKGLESDIAMAAESSMLVSKIRRFFGL